MSMYSLIEYTDNYPKSSGGLWQYYRDKPPLITSGAIPNFPGNSGSFKRKQKTAGQTECNGTKNVDVMVPLKHLSNFWRTLDMPLFN